MSTFRQSDWQRLIGWHRVCSGLLVGGTESWRILVPQCVVQFKECEAS